MEYKMNYVSSAELVEKIQAVMTNQTNEDVIRTSVDMLMNVCITDVSMQIDTVGGSSINFTVDSLEYCKLLGHLNHSLPIQVYIDTPLLTCGSMYNFTFFYENTANKEILFITMQVTYNNNKNDKYISIQNGLRNCPSCGQPLTYYLDNGDYVCKNPFCLAKRVFAILRYVNISMRAPELAEVIRHLAILKVIATPTDIYSIDQSILRNNGVPDHAIPAILSRIESTIGRVSFCDYLYSLPNVDYLLGGFNINRANVYTSFDNPETFLIWINKIGDATRGRTFQAWKAKHGEAITYFMSLSFFWKIYEYLYTMTDELISGKDIILDLYKRGIFAPFIRG